MPEREYSKICLFYITPFPTLIFGSQENFDSVVSIDKWFFGNSFYERWLPSKLFLYNFSAANIYETFFHNVCVGKTACFNFCSHFYKKFVANSLYYQSVIYEHMEICCSCLECLNNFSLKTFFWAEKRLFYWFEKPFDTILLWLRQWLVYGWFYVGDLWKRSLGILSRHTLLWTTVYPLKKEII